MSFEQRVVQLELTNAELVSSVIALRDAAIGLGFIFPTVSQGVQQVADGKYFVVPSDGTTHYQNLYRRNGNSADLVASYPGTEGVVKVFDDQVIQGTKQFRVDNAAGDRMEWRRISGSNSGHYGSHLAYGELNFSPVEADNSIVNTGLVIGPDGHVGINRRPQSARTLSVGGQVSILGNNHESYGALRVYTENNTDIRDENSLNYTVSLQNDTSVNDVPSVGLSMSVSGSTPDTPGAALLFTRTDGWSQGRFSIYTKDGSSSGSPISPKLEIEPDGTVSVQSGLVAKNGLSWASYALGASQSLADMAFNQRGSRFTQYLNADSRDSLEMRWHNSTSNYRSPVVFYSEGDVLLNEGVRGRLSVNRNSSSTASSTDTGLYVNSAGPDQLRVAVNTSWVATITGDSVNLRQGAYFTEDGHRVVESGGSRETGWYVRFSNGIVIMGIYRANFEYNTSNVLSCRFNFPIEVASVIDVQATPVDPYVYNGTSLSDTSISHNMPVIRERIRGSGYSRLQMGRPGDGTGWSAGDILQGNITVTALWTGTLEGDE